MEDLVLNSLKPKLSVVIFKLSVLFLKENTTLYHYKDQLVTAVKKVIAIYSVSRMKAQSAELLLLKVGGTVHIQ
jgi:hypothetical protein